MFPFVSRERLLAVERDYAELKIQFERARQEYREDREKLLDRIAEMSGQAPLYAPLPDEKRIVAEPPKDEKPAKAPPAPVDFNDLVTRVRMKKQQLSQGR